MATPPRTIKRLPAQRVAELLELEKRLLLAIDMLKLARVYSAEGEERTAADRLEGARTATSNVLEELNTFREPARAGAASTPEADGQQ